MIDVTVEPMKAHISATTLAGFLRAADYVRERISAEAEMARLRLRLATVERDRDEWRTRARAAEVRLGLERAKRRRKDSVGKPD